MSTTIPRPADAAVRETKDAATADPKGRKGKKKSDKTDAPASKKKKRILIVVAVLGVLAAAYLFVLKPKPATSGAPEPGPVVRLDPLTLNLEGGHYLKLTLALQFTKTAAAGGGHGGAETPDGSKALDIAIAQLSNRKIAELNSAAARTKAKKTLLEAVGEAYHHDVMDIYFTEFVMQ
jgi:flagellar FliL protein